MSAKTYEYWMMKHFLLQDGIWLIQVLPCAMSPEQVPSAETFFSCQNVTSTGFDKF